VDDDQTVGAEHHNFRSTEQYEYQVRRFRAGRAAEAEQTESALAWTQDRIAKGRELRGEN
jgi:hypothetical protein